MLNNLCSQLQLFWIECFDLNEEDTFKMFDGLDFPNLSKLEISNIEINGLEKQFFDRFPKLESFSLQGSLEIIEPDTFSNLKSLKELNLASTDLEKLDRNMFVGLDNLEKLDLTDNPFTYFDLSILDYIPKIKSINLCVYSISNKEEILNRFKGSDIKIIFK